MPRITASQVVSLSVFSFIFSIFYLFSSTSKIIDNDMEGAEYDLDAIDTEIDYARRQLDEIADPSLNRVQFLKLDEDAYAFSAYTDDRNGNMGYKHVRILLFLTKEDEFLCEINGKRSYGVTLYELSENHKMKWSLYILNCALPDGIPLNNVNSVKISRISTGSVVYIPIRYRIQDEKSMTPDEYDYRMSICVPALFGNAYYARRIIEFVELNKLQGIEKIFIYYNPTEMNDQGTRKTLEYYYNNQMNQSPITVKNVISTKYFETRFTKCVIRPEMVFEQGIHHTSRVVQDNYETPFHDGSLLRVYHYREPKYCCDNESILKDKYENQLQEAFDSVIELLEV
uniref:Glycosyltransferase family 92 protein n=2 Tax=Caenorhabditis tropicalis TaxID=1561998 RepID=A0A1I7T3L9_9PELO